MSTPQILLHRGSIAHRTGYGHPERSDRINSVASIFDESLDFNYCLAPLELHRAITPTLIHTGSYLESLEKLQHLPDGAVQELYEDTSAGKESYAIAREVLSLQEQAIDLVWNKGEPTFVLARPPGHHALTDVAMGYCLLANLAYAARYAQKNYGAERVAIIDWDVHHGNGSEAIFLADPSVLTISLHAYPYWPEGFGEPESRGEGAGEGFNLNLPLPMEAGDWQYIQYFNNYVLPALHAFKPDLLLVAAGFDAHQLERRSGTCETSGMALTENGYSYMTYQLHNFAKRHCRGRIHFSLEGGYNTQSLKSSVVAVLETLARERLCSYSEISQGALMDTHLYDSYCKRIESGYPFFSCSA